MACKDPEMARLVGAYELGLLPRDKRAEFETHLLRCDACFEDLCRMDPAASLLREGWGAPKAEIDLSGEQVQAEIDRPVRARPSIGKTRWRWSFAATAAAAIVLIVIGLRHVGPWGEDRRLRGPGQGSVVCLSPTGEVSSPPEELDWKIVAGALSYEVRICDQAGQDLWQDIAAGPPVDIPREVQKSFEPGGTYFWQVEALCAEGARLASAPTRFTIRN